MKKFDHMHPMLKKHSVGHFLQKILTARWRYFSIEYTAKGFIKISSLD